MLRRSSVALVAFFVAAGCGKHHNGGKGVGGGHGGDRDGTVTFLPGAVGVLVDGKRVANVAPDQARWTPIVDLLPKSAARAKDVKAWERLEIHTRAGRITTMPLPATAQPGQIAALFPGKDGVDFGVFAPADLAKHANPKLIETDVDDVRIDLVASADTAGSDAASDQPGSDQASGGAGNGEGNGSNRAASGDGPDLSKIDLTIAAGGKELHVTGDDLAKLAKIAPPIGDTDTTGWNLIDVLATKSLAVPATGTITISDESGASVPVAKAQLDPKTGLAFFKVNKKGELRFRLYALNKGGTWDTVGELRGVNRVDLGK